MQEYLKLYDESVESLVEKAYRITQENFKREVEFCSIVSAKTGACPEDCKYCSQSVHSSSEIETSALMSVEEVKKAALSAKENGAVRFGVVTSGTKPTDEEFKRILEMMKEISSIDGMEACACLGILDEEQMRALKASGCTRYNHNINTNEEFYNKICTTHLFEDRIKTIELAVKCGLEVCVGVIIGMGETREDRIKMALKLKELNPTSVPINILDPIKGTPLENIEEISVDEIIKTISIFRIIMPNVSFRLAGGRMKLPDNYQKLALMAGVNALITGNYLTTTGCTKEHDLKMLEFLGMEKK